MGNSVRSPFKVHLTYHLNTNILEFQNSGSGSRRHDLLHAIHSRSLQSLETADKVVGRKVGNAASCLSPS